MHDEGRESQDLNLHKEGAGSSADTPLSGPTGQPKAEVAKPIYSLHLSSVE